MENHNVIKEIIFNALLAAIYIVITIVSSSFSYLGIQFRLAEILILLCFFNPKYMSGILIGTFISNLFSPLGYYDWIFGTLATFLSCLCIAFSPKLLLGIFAPILINGVIVGLCLAHIYQLNFFLQFALVALGEASVLLVLGYPLFMVLMRKEYIRKIFNVKKHHNFKW